MFYWIYDISTETLAVLMTVLFVGFSWCGTIVIRPILRIFVRSAAGTNDIVGYILSCFCVFYGLLLGLIAVAAYQNYSQVDSAVQSEAAILESLYDDVSTYPEPHGQNLRWLLRDYCRYEIKYAWPQYRQGVVPDGGDTRIRAFKERLANFEPRTKDDEIMHAESIRQFNTFLQHRRLREYAVTTGIPAVMWYVVIVGAIINIALAWLFEMKLVTHLFLGGIAFLILGRGDLADCRNGQSVSGRRQHLSRGIRDRLSNHDGGELKTWLASGFDRQWPGRSFAICGS